MANKQVYTLDINTSGLISGYKNAIKQMEQAGASADVTKGLTASLKKLEDQYERLSNEGKAGFTNSREIDSFKKRVDRLMSSFRGFEASLDKVGGDVSKLAVKSKDAGAKIEKAFNKLGFKNVDLAMKNILASEDKIKATSTVIEKELADRVKIVDKLSEKYQKAANAAQQAANAATARTARAKETGADSLKLSYENGKGGKSPIFNKGTAGAARKNEILREAAEAIKASEDITAAWARMEQYIKDHGFEKYFSGVGGANGMAGLRQNMENVFKETARVAQEEGVKVQAALERQAQAQEEVNEATKKAQEIGKQSKDGTWSVDASRTREITAAVRERISAEDKLHQSLTVDVNDEQAVQNALNGVSSASSSVAGNAMQAEGSLDGMIDTLGDTARGAESAAKSFDNMRNRILSLLSATSVLNLIKRTVKETYEDVKQLDKSFASIAMVTNYSVSEMWGKYSEYADMAAKLGQETNSIIQASALFYQQGLDTNEALALTTDTMKLATLAGNDFSTATQEMTSAIRGFKMEMDEGGRVADVYSNLAAHAAATVDDIAQAMARTASIANSAGMSFENTSAFLTQMIETTQESAENIGTSLKTIIARFTELKENVAGTADSEFDDLEYNKVDKALKSVGVSLKDVNGQFRNLDEVFLELSEKWDTLDRNTQRYVATIAAGSRQQSRFIAMMDNYERTTQLMEYAADAEGKADEQFAKYADTMEYKLNQLSTKWEEFRVQTLNSDFFKGAIDGLSNLLNRLKNVDFKKALIVGPAAIWAAKNFISSFLIGFKKNIGQLKTLGKEIGKAISKDKPKIDIQLQQQLVKKQISDLETQLSQITSKPHLLELGVSNTTAKDMVAQYKAEVEATTGAEISWADAVRKLAQELGVETGALNTDYEAIKKKQQEMQKLSQEYDEAQQKQAQLDKQQQKSALASQATSAAISAATMALSGFISGTMSGSEALKTFALQLGISAAQMLLSATIASVTSGIKAAAAKTEEQAWWAVFFAETAATMGAALLVVAIMGALVVVALLCAALIKQGEEAREAADATAQLANANKELEEASAKVSASKSKIKELKSEKKTLQEMVAEYNQLYNKSIKTEDEWDRMKELQEQIEDQYPEIISYHNEINDTIVIGNTAYDERIDKIDTEIEKENELLKVNEANAAAAAKSVQSYQMLSDVQSITGAKVNATTQSDDYAAMVRGEKKLTDADVKHEYVYTSEGGYWNNGEFYSALESFAKELTDGEVDLENAAKDTRDKFLETWNYVMTGEGDIIDEYRDAAEEMRKKMIEAAEAFAKIPEEFQAASMEAVEEKYSSASETEKQLRAFYGMDRANQEVIAYNEISGVKSTGDKSSVVKSNKAIAKALGFDENDAEIKQLIDDYADIYDAIAEGAWNNWDNFGHVQNELNDRQEKILEQQFEITDQSSYDSKWGNGGTSDKSSAVKVQKQFYANLLEKKFSDEELYKVDQDMIDRVASLQTEVGTMTADEALAEWKVLTDSIANETPELQEKIKGMINLKPEDITQIQSTVSNLFGSQATKDWDIDLSKAFSDVFNKAIESGATEQQAKDYVKSIEKNFEDLKIDQSHWQDFLTLDMSKITDPVSLEAWKKEQKQLFKEQGIANADAMIDAMAEEADKNGVIDIHINTPVELDEFIEKLDELKDKIEDFGDSVVDATKDMKENGEVSFKTFQSAQKALTELGLSAYDYFNIDSNGKITTDTEKLAKLYKDQLKAQEQQLVNDRNRLIVQNNELKAKAAGVQADIISLKNGDQRSLIENKITQEKADQLELTLQTIAAMKELIGESFDVSKYQTVTVKQAVKMVTDDMIAAKQKELDAYNSSIAINDETIKSMTQEIDNFDKYSAAAFRDFDMRMLEAEGLEKDVTKATEDHKKALEDLEKAQKDVADKQEALNEKLKEYNDLLYGKDNRKSTLDFLYNYDEAINSFNDEISRSKELLEDSKSVQESTDALKRYAAATHNLITEETAKQQVIKAGLENYSKMIEGGSYSYTNRETGEKTNINFGDYAKKDSRTGKYIIDQRLINEAHFTDEIKDLLEEQVSTYNKYSEELLKSEDNVRKAEKALQDERKNAVKNYAAMETEIAEALKQQYQDEVDALKDKYDAMKDADDDYLDALQDAIDKQRKLRDQESKYEDLAKKEKKLSLMQRDTSGSNALEVKQLEEDVQKTREELLDEAIDNVIEGLSELYESQQELRDEEMELKEALIDNTLYWNTQAEALAGSFQSAEEYAAFLSSLSEEYAMMTLAQQQVKLNEYGDTYTAASEYMAMQAMDSASITGDFIVDTVTVSGEEVSTIVAETAETFTTEVTRAYNETTTAFEEDMRKAEESIDDAKQALQEAIEKLHECAEAANAAAAAVAEANRVSAGGGGGTGIDTTAPEDYTSSPSTQSLVNWNSLYNSMLGMAYTSNNGSNERFSSKPNGSYSHSELAQYIDKIYSGGSSLSDMQKLVSTLGMSTTEGNTSTALDRAQLYQKIKERLIAVDSSLASVFKYDEGGLVNYTGPAWVDGTLERPEAFLSAEDTERIGNAAKILADIPWMDRETDNTSVVTNNGGDVSVEINLNIDHISSDTDIDEMIERVKDEIVEVARPEGTNVILQQQLN